MVAIDLFLNISLKYKDISEIHIKGFFNIETLLNTALSFNTIKENERLKPLIAKNELKKQKLENSKITDVYQAYV